MQPPPLETTSETKLKRYSLVELSGVPNTPGIYAWYGRLILGPPDWKTDHDPAKSVDHGTQRLRLALRAHSDRYRPPPLQTASYTGFRDHWTGVMEAKEYELAADAITQDQPLLATKLGFPAEQLKRTMSREKRRGALATAIDSLTPIFAAPLYIGKTKALRSRLESHARELRLLSDQIKDDVDKLENLKEKVRGGSVPRQADETQQVTKPVNFAARAIAAGFSPDMLYVYVLETTELIGSDEEAAEDLACAIEWFANTWYRPLLGKK